jgi:arylsulfatase A-like enzyme
MSLQNQRYLLLLLIFFSCNDDDIILSEVQPNFLIFITDDQRYDAMGIVQREQGENGRFPWYNTPNLDRLAAQGMRFRNAFVVNSLCSPSRAAMFTGRYGHSNGINNNNTPFNSASYASILQDFGYRTAYFGKWHMGEQSGKRPGFGYSFSFVGQGQYVDAPFEENGQKVETSGWVDHVTTDHLLDYLQQNHQKPFCYVTEYKAPHGPWNDIPPFTSNELNEVVFDSVPNLYLKPTFEYDEFYNQISYEFIFPEGDKNALRYILEVDRDMGRVLDVLDSLDIRDNTYVIFLSDNGYYYGEHGLRDKRTAYEESMRIPFLISGPGIEKNQTGDNLVLNIDVAPTILDLAEVGTGEIFHGTSIKPLLMGTHTNWRTSFLYEYFKESIEPPFDVFAVRTDHYKLIEYKDHPDWMGVFDLQNDPYEIQNLADSIEQLDLILELKDELRRLAAETGLSL